jgi:hypothetical protein
LVVIVVAALVLAAVAWGAVASPHADANSTNSTVAAAKQTRTGRISTPFPDR